ncbi:hypothetical protein PAESOLCIP111_03624 [Paenibacillus solanacearum]|uniref:Uncharacterized protein n=1 Tax=Paenibacillus solanacearum TaxID=2048548 RepID=A0A916K5N3_9BACL|nr:hypothetical protein [Paenibacillus solanacearum]CAG7635094.1 hypothetical protein PAESOLCIP111_03624 [Paenibacillus solanacearum]
MKKNNPQDERTVLDNLQDAMLRQTKAVAFVNSLFPDQIDTHEAIEQMREERRKSES